ncbi:MAG: tryptophan synthase subunit alpha [Thermoguttaceae bacterium]|jgi:tryptophan synthase alpha chain|nr:tryptophan synthase subunit alpha [Thermoguttaceae bacterium]
MSAIDTLFAQLRPSGRKAFMPFVTAGDPDLDFTAEVLRCLVAQGSSLCELGIPYSDPIADGPVIQASYTRALDKNLKLADVFAMLRGLAPDLAAPVVTMVSYAIIYRRGLETYVAQAQDAGVAGAIVPDLPVEEAGPLAAICRRRDFSLIQLITPTTPRERALRIAEETSGFIYYVSVTGITGERTELPRQLLDNVAWLRGRTSLPICIGFGVSRPEHVRMLAPVADGLIVGSAIVRRVAEAASRPRREVLAEIGDYAAELLGALSG